MNLEQIIRMARGDAPAQLVLRNARVVNVLSDEIIDTSVAIANTRNVGFGDYEGEDEMDMEGA